jgi:hypothetical protein
MDTEDTSSSSPLPSEDEKKAQKELDHLRKRLIENERGAFKTPQKWIGFQGKTLWDWLQLLGILAIPLVVAGATILFGIQQANLANQQHENDQKIALDQQQAATLQTYIDNIQDLLLHDNLQKANSIDNANPYYDIAILARARTLTALQVLDPERKGRLVQFLYEAQLIGYADFGSQGDIKKKYDPIIALGTANLRGAKLHAVHGVALGGADFSGADLSDADLTSAILEGAILESAILEDVDLTDANLYNADLTDTNLTHALLTQQQLDQVLTCRGAILPPGLICLHN